MHQGTRTGSNATSEVAVAHRGKHLAVIGTGWRKASDKTVVGGYFVNATSHIVNAWGTVYNGDPAQAGPSSITADGTLGAVLIEPTPAAADESGVLMLFNPTNPTPVYTRTVRSIATL